MKNQIELLAVQIILLTKMDEVAFEHAKEMLIERGHPRHLAEAALEEVIEKYKSGVGHRMKWALGEDK